MKIPIPRFIMLLFIYNIIQILLLLLLSPLLGLIICCTPKYRGRIGGRLGFGLKRILIPDQRKVIWVHALSVGEVASARPLLKAIKAQHPDFFLVLSSTTRGGADFAKGMGDIIDLFIPFPLDILFVVKKFISHISPDLFILIETDFWPNFLHEIHRQKIPSILANGRITTKSLRNYRRGRFFFKMLFGVFDVVAMQTKDDAKEVVGLGVDSDRVVAMGNLKYDSLNVVTSSCRISFYLSSNCPVLVAGSTHPGEEEIVLGVFKKLLAKFPDLILVIAPRDVARGAALCDMAIAQSLSVSLRSDALPLVPPGTILVLDTLGELTALYNEAWIVFVGGSLEKFGGHNPLEAAMLAKPVIYGPHMEDFQEIAADLLAVDGAYMVYSEEEFFSRASSLLENEELAKSMGANGANMVGKQSGASKRYADMVESIIRVKK